jgi:hypothetical protein
MGAPRYSREMFLFKNSKKDSSSLIDTLFDRAVAFF